MGILGRVLFITDKHKRDVDFTSIKGYVKVSDKQQLHLLDVIAQKNITHLVFLGDWYDKGYRSINRDRNDDNFDREFKNSVNGNAYICLGNHVHIERESNPELYMIQPSPVIQPLHPIYQKEPIFKAEHYLRIGHVQISFFHFNQTDKDYIREVEDGVTYHVGCYHDDCVLPTDIRSQAGYVHSTSTSYLEKIYNNIDLGIYGHIHVKIGTTYISTPTKQLPAIIPGSLAIVQNKDIYKHPSVDLPILEIRDDGTHSLEFVNIPTFLNDLKFYNKNAHKSNIELDTQIFENKSSNFTPELEVKEDILSTSLLGYIKSKNLPDAYLELVDRITKTDITTEDVITILNKEDNENGI